MLTQEDLLTFIDNVCALLRKQLHPQLHNWSFPSIDLRTESGVMLSWGNRPAFEHHLLSRIMRKESHFIDPFVEILGNDPRYTKLNIKESDRFQVGYVLSTYTLLLNLFSSYLRYVNDLSPRIDVATRVSERFLQSLECGKSRYCFLSPLVGVSKASEPFELEEGVIIDYTPEEFVLTLMQKESIHSHFDSYLSNPVAVMIYGEARLDESIEARTQDALTTIRRVEQSVRLANNGTIFAGEMYTISAIEGEIKPYGIGGIRGRKDHPVHNSVELSNYKLTQAVFKRLSDNSTLPRSLELSLSRFGFALSRRELSDAVVDIVIALEALFSKGPSTALSYKVPLFASLYLTNDLVKRREIRALLSTVYDVRNKLVHGSAKGLDRPTLTAAIDVARDLICKSLLHGVPDPKSIDDQLLG